MLRTCLPLLTAAALALTAAPALAAPANDPFSGAVTLSGVQASANGTTAGATREAGEPASLVWGGVGRTVWYRWTPAADGGTKVSVCGFDARVAVYTGGSVGGLTEITDGSCERTFMADGGTTYRIVVDGYTAAAGAPFALSLKQVTKTPNLTLAQPLTKTAGKGTVGLTETTGAQAPVVQVCTVDGIAEQCYQEGGQLKFSWAGLTTGQHTAKLVVRDAYLNVDPTPLVVTWTVDATPPDTTILGLDGSGNFGSASFTASEPATFQCSVSGSAWTGCSSPSVFPFVGTGYGLRVRAFDTVGNGDVTPAEQLWKRPLPPIPAQPATAPQPASPLPGTATPTPTSPTTTASGVQPGRPGAFVGPPACRVGLSAPGTFTRAQLRRGVRIWVAGDPGCSSEFTVLAGSRTLLTIRGRGARHRRLVLRLGAKALRHVRPGSRLQLHLVARQAGVRPGVLVTSRRVRR